MPAYGVAFTATFSAWDTATNAPKTGDSGNITPRWSKDGTASALTAPAVTEIDAVNFKGLYKVAISATEAQCFEGTVGGETSTASVVIVPKTYGFVHLPNAAPDAAGGLPISDAGGLDMDAVATGAARALTALPAAAADAAGGLPISDAGALDLDILLARLDAAITTRNAVVPDAAGTAAGLHVATDALITTVDAVVDAIKIVTDNLPNAGALNDLATLASRLSEVRAGYLDKLNVAGTLAHSALVIDVLTLSETLVRMLSFLAGDFALDSTGKIVTHYKQDGLTTEATETISATGRTVV